MKSKHYILFFLSIFMCLLSSTCYFFLVNEDVYDYITTGKHFSGDDFEINNGSFSTIYPWELEYFHKPYVSNMQSYKGEWAVEFAQIKDGQVSKFSLEVNFTSDKELSFWVKKTEENFYNDAELFFYCDDWKNSIYSSGVWTKNTYFIDAGDHTLEWSYVADDYSSDIETVWIDTIEVHDFLTNRVPADNAVITDTTPLLSWETSSTSPQFHLEVSDKRDFSDTIIDTDTIIQTQYQVASALSNNKRYYWRLKKKIDETEWENTWSQSFSFVILGQMVSDDFEVTDSVFSVLNPWQIGDAIFPIIQTTDVYSGTQAVTLTGFGSSETIYFQTETQFPVPKIVSFWLMTEPSSGTFDFFCDTDTFFSRGNYSSAFPWHKLAYLIDTDQHTLKWNLDSNSTISAKAVIDAISIQDVSPFLDDDFETNDGTTSLTNLWIYKDSNSPYLQNTESNSGDWAIEFPGFYGNNQSFIETIVEVPQDQIISFYIKAESNTGDIQFIEDTITRLDTDVYYISAGYWRQVYVAVSEGFHTLQWANDRYYDSSTAKIWIDDISVANLDAFTSDDFETNDSTFSTLNTWFRYGDALPFVQGTEVNTGSWAVQFGDIADNQESIFLAGCNFTSQKTIRFYIKTDCSYADYLEFYIDNTRQFYAYTSTTWQQRFYTLSAGLHILKWRYRKDSSGSGGLDTAWIDDITIE